QSGLPPPCGEGGERSEPGGGTFDPVAANDATRRSPTGTHTQRSVIPGLDPGTQKDARRRDGLACGLSATACVVTPTHHASRGPPSPQGGGRPDCIIPTPDCRLPP